ncbi:MAG: pantoate--beta-alanine ligase [Betaproteobacteria bacterium]|nr:pantoate--beta-alanine ligase [Betaproteobacteria bacterium]
MDVIHTVAELRRRLAAERRVGFVPTMGNLHTGHLDLTRIAARHAACTVVSIFVNRLQFGPSEDFDRYPRTLGDDCVQCEAAGVSIVFAPDESEMYPAPQSCTVDPGPIQHILDGVARPGHFRGVATVVLKLFGMVQPQVAVFGRKDYQQCKVIEGLVTQFSLPIELVFAPTSRADDGLALSSRNGYLSVTERAEAPWLNAELRRMVDAIRAGQREYSQLEAASVAALVARGWQPDYITVRRQSDLEPATAADRSLVLLAAARLGSTRLIDNVELSL